MSATAFLGGQDEDRRRTVPAFLASLIIHLLLILLAAVFFALRPAPVAPPVEETPMELTFIELPTAKPKNKPAYVETSESQRAKAPPENLVFESDKDTLAASERPAAGNAPVPTQDGVKSPALQFENKDNTAGPKPRPAVAVAPPAQPQPPAESAQPQEPVTEPALTARQTTQLALLEPPKPQPTPKPKTQNPPKPQDRPPHPIPNPESRIQNPSPPPPSPRGYQPQTRVTRIRGNISNRGRSAVDATATPLGRYKKTLSDAIGSRWYYYVNEQMSLLTMGTVEVRFIVQQDGKAKKVQVVRNTSNESFAACSVRAVMEAEIPPIPKDLVPMLENGRIEIEYSFTLLSN